MMDWDDWNEHISDEALAAFIDGNATAEEINVISNMQLSDGGLLLEALDVVHDCMLVDCSNLLNVEEDNNAFETNNETFDISDSQTNLGVCLGCDELFSLSGTINEVNMEYNDLGESETFNDNDFNLF